MAIFLKMIFIKPRNFDVRVALYKHAHKERKQATRSGTKF
jgi:hypothetical protein